MEDFMTNNELYRKIDAIVENHKDNKPIVAILQDVQEEYRYIPREAGETGAWSFIEEKTQGD